jgi:hypothetical protein
MIAATDPASVPRNRVADQGRSFALRSGRVSPAAASTAAAAAVHLVAGSITSQLAESLAQDIQAARAALVVRPSGGIDPGSWMPSRPNIGTAQPPVETSAGHLQHQAQPLDAEGATMILDELEATHQLVSPAKYFAALRRISRSSSRSFTRARNCRFSRSNTLACPAPGRAACSASRTQTRNVSWLTPKSLATDAYVPPAVARYNATASARNSGEYSTSPTGTPVLWIDLHDPTIRVSTIKG